MTGEAGPGGDADAGEALATARTEVATLKGDPEFQKAFGDPRHPGYGGAVAKLQAANGRVRALEAGEADPGGYDGGPAAERAQELRRLGVDAETAAELLPPETPADYKLPYVGREDGVAPDEAARQIEAARGWAHQVGFTQTEFRALTDRINEFIAKPELRSPETLADRQERCKAILARTWGDKAGERIEAVSDAIGALGDEAIAWLAMSGLGADPQLWVTMWAAISRRQDPRFQSLAAAIGRGAT